MSCTSGGGNLHIRNVCPANAGTLSALDPHLLIQELRQYMATLLIIILVLFLLGGGGWGYSRWRG